MQELFDFIKREHVRLHNAFRLEKGVEVLARTVKLSEETGELCEGVLTSIGLQRKEKLGSWRKDNIQESSLTL